MCPCVLETLHYHLHHEAEIRHQGDIIIIIIIIIIVNIIIIIVFIIINVIIVIIMMMMTLLPKLVNFLILSDCGPLPPKPYDSIRFLSSFSKNEPISPRILHSNSINDDSQGIFLTTKVFFLQPRYFS